MILYLGGLNFVNCRVVTSWACGVLGLGHCGIGELVVGSLNGNVVDVRVFDLLLVSVNV